MKKALLFPGQGAQAPGMAKDLYAQSEHARARFAEAAEILGFDIGAVMFDGTAEALTKTSITQPAIYLHSVILAEALNADADMAAGHSLGEFSALAVAGALSFEDGLRLVSRRAQAMQMACDLEPSTMAAIVGLDDAAVEALCAEVLCAEVQDAIVAPANYNAVGQLVISGSVAGVEAAVALAKARGAKLAKLLQVNGAFHSPLMQPAAQELDRAIDEAMFRTPRFPVYQNYTAQPATDPAVIRANLKAQLTAPVRWTQTIRNMAAAGAGHFLELGPGKVLQGLVKRIESEVTAESRSEL